MKIPNELTQAAMREAELLGVIRDLLRYAVYDEARNDECISAVEAAKEVMRDASDFSFMDEA